MIFGVLKCRQDKKKIIEYVDSNRDYFNSVDIETAQAMAEMLHYRKVMDLVQDDGKEACNMCKALEDLYNDGVAEGIIGSIIDFLNDYGTVPEYLNEKIHGESDIDLLRRWIKLAARVSSIEEFEEQM